MFVYKTPEKSVPDFPPVALFVIALFQKVSAAVFIF